MSSPTFLDIIGTKPGLIVAGAALTCSGIMMLAGAPRADLFLIGTGILTAYALVGVLIKRASPNQDE